MFSGGARRRKRRARSFSKGDDDLAEMGPRRQMAIGVLRRVKGEGRIDDGLDLVEGERPVHRLEHAG